MMKTKIKVIVEKTNNGFFAHSDDDRNVYTTGHSIEELRINMLSALQYLFSHPIDPAIIEYSFEKLSIFDLEFQYQEYLRLCNVVESNMEDVQRIEMRRAFMGGCGQLLLLLRNDLGALPEQEGAALMQKMLDETTAFWQSQKSFD